MKSGIYQIRNLVNGKVYIGKSKNLQKRKNDHFCFLNNKIHANSYLQRAYGKYGKDNFIFEIVEYVDNVEEKLIEREQFWIDSKKSNERKNGYNIRIKAESNKGISSGLIGEKNHQAKLTWKQVRKIREEYRTNKCSISQLARKNKVCISTIQQIIEARCWKEKGIDKIIRDKEMVKESAKGEKNHQAKLTWKQVEEIREKYIPRKYTQVMLIAEYGISRATIFNILNNKTWKE